MKPRVTVVDYGLGNLYSVGRALEVCGAEVSFASEGAEVEAADYLVLPGVGAFEAGMAGLRKRQLVDPIRAHARSGKPLLGICLGMQMLASVSEEFGEHEGLDLIPGRVQALPAADVDGRVLKVPHIGWTPLLPGTGMSWQGTALANIQEGESVYLVHSYAMEPEDPADRLAICIHGGRPVCVVVRRGALIGCQFHPEKSGPTGLRLIASFLAGAV